MESILAWRHGTGSEDSIAVHTATGATVGDVAICLTRALPAGQDASDALRVPTLRVSDTSVHGTPGHIMPPAQPFHDAPLLSGTTIELCEATAHACAAPPRGEARVRLTHPGGHVQEVSLDRPVASVGSDTSCDIVLEAEGVEPVHAWIDTREGTVVSASDTATLEVDGRHVFETSCTAPHAVRVAGIGLMLLPAPALTHAHAGEAASLVHVPTSRFIPRLEVPQLQLPQAPQPARPTPFPTFMLVAPVVIATLMYLLLRSPLVLMFAVLMPAFALATYASQCRNAAYKAREDRQRFDDAGARFSLVVHDFHVRERERAEALHPDPAQVWAAARSAHTLLWSIPERLDGEWEVRVGTGTRPSLMQVPESFSAELPSEIALMLAEWAAEASALDAAPVTLNLAAGPVAIVGEGQALVSAMRALLVRMSCTYSPHSLHLLVCGGAQSADLAREAVWLPHVQAARTWSPAIAVDDEGERMLLRSVEALIQARMGEPEQSDGASEIPVRVMIMVHAAGVRDTAAWMWVARHGAGVGVTVLWWGDLQVPIPASCTQVLHLSAGGARLEDMQAGTLIEGIEIDPEPGQSEEVSRVLAPLVDVRAGLRGGGEIPTAVSLSQVAQLPAGPLVDQLRSRWAKNDSRAQRLLVAPVGVAADGIVTLSLVHDGPHALVAGTTGSGKSELLRSWVLSLAVEYSPAALTFLFIDYKGGAAFQSCADLPHCVGVVTDLTGTRVRRALTSLRAELRRRESILAAAGVPDLEGLLKLRGVEPLPALVIVIDEFAALVREEPAFMDELIDIAARGRSLGIHLILATQKPAGVVSGRIRANTSLRIALRVADETDSHDVLGSAQAARISPSTVGRAYVRRGPAAPEETHIAYSGTPAPSAPGPLVRVHTAVGPQVELAQLPVPPSAAHRGEEPVASDAERILAAAHEVMHLQKRSMPRRPWREPLQERYRYEDLNAGARASSRAGRRSQGRSIALADCPAQQAQFPLRYHPLHQPRVCVTGPHHAGRSMALRALLASALEADAHAYLVDSGSLGGAASAAGVVAHVSPADRDRCLRLFRTLTRVLESRLARLWAAGSHVGAGADAGEFDGGLLVLAIDSYAALTESLSPKENLLVDTALAALVRDGARVQIAVLCGQDRPREVPRSIGALIDVRITFALTSHEDRAMAGMAGILPAQVPPGRGVAEGWVSRVDGNRTGGSGTGGSRADGSGHHPGTGMNEAGADNAVECHVAEVADDTFANIPAPATAPIPVHPFPQSLVSTQLPAARPGHWMLAVDWDACLPVQGALRGAWLVCTVDPASGRGLLAACMKAAEATHRIVVVDEEPPKVDDVLADGAHPDGAHSDSAYRGGAQAGMRSPVLLVVLQCQARRSVEAERRLLEMSEAVLARGGMVIGAVSAGEVLRSHPVTSRFLREGNALMHGVKEATVFQVCQRSVSTPPGIPEAPGRGWILESGRPRFVHFVDTAVAVTAPREGGESHEPCTDEGDESRGA